MSFVAVMSVCGLALGVAVLIVVLSVMNGFERELRSRILSVTSHATLTGLRGPIRDWRRCRRSCASSRACWRPCPTSRARRCWRTASTSPAPTSAACCRPRSAAPRASRRIDGREHRGAPGGSFASSSATRWRRARRAGRRQRGADRPGGHGDAGRRGAAHAALSRRRHLPVRHVRVRPRPRAGEPRRCRALYRMGDGVTGLRLAFGDPLRAPAVVRTAALSLGGGYYVSDWTEATPTSSARSRSPSRCCS